MLRFANKSAFYLFVLIPAFILFFLYVKRRRRKLLKAFGELDLLEKLMTSVNPKKRLWKKILLLLALAFFIVALARPQLGSKLEEVEAKGIDLVVALDVSYSMRAEDIKPNRISKAKYELKSIIDKLKGDRIGIVVFAGDAFTLCPLTTDYNAAKMLMDAIDVDIISEQGTDLTRALEVCGETFVKEEKKHKVLLLISDGEVHSPKPVEAAKKLGSEGVKIYTVGIGSPSGVPIPLFNKHGNQIGYKKNNQGEVVTTELNEKILQKVALSTDAKYFRASPGQSELDAIYSDIEKMEQKEFESKKFTHFEDRYQYPLGLGLLLLILQAFIIERKEK